MQLNIMRLDGTPSVNIAIASVETFLCNRPSWILVRVKAGHLVGHDALVVHLAKHTVNSTIVVRILRAQHGLSVVNASELLALVISVTNLSNDA